MPLYSDIRNRILTFVVTLGGSLLFFFVPETFWDRTPTPKHVTGAEHHVPKIHWPRSRLSTRNLDGAGETNEKPTLGAVTEKRPRNVAFENLPYPTEISTTVDSSLTPNLSSWQSPTDWAPVKGNDALDQPSTPDLRNLNSPWYNEKAETSGKDYISMGSADDPSSFSPPLPLAASPSNQTPALPSAPKFPLSLPANTGDSTIPVTLERSALKLPKLILPELPLPGTGKQVALPERSDRGSDDSTAKVLNDVLTRKPSAEFPDTESCLSSSQNQAIELGTSKYTDFYRAAPAKTYWQTLRPFSGRFCHDNWLRVAFRPFVLFAYPAILWSSVVYALSVGWLIVLSESVSSIYKNRESYNFTSFQTGLIYISPFIGGILGTAVAGKVSDLIVRFMSRRNGGIYEPEFRLVMAIPIALATGIGLMGFGWSAQERDNWIVPTVFFGIISFGCSLGSTTAITFAVDSYRVYAGEALVTLNFSKSMMPPFCLLSCY